MSREKRSQRHRGGFQKMISCQVQRSQEHLYPFIGHIFEEERKKEVRTEVKKVKEGCAHYRY